MKLGRREWWLLMAVIAVLAGGEMVGIVIGIVHSKRQTALKKSAAPPAPAPAPELTVDASRTRTGEATWYHVPAKSLARRRAPADEMTAASDDLPLQTLVRVTLLEHDEPPKSVDVRITDNGIHQKGVIIDLDREAAEKLGMVREGMARVRVEVLEETATSPPGPSATPR
jgi:rare lipoprotein A